MLDDLINMRSSTSMDVLTDLLQRARARGAAFAQTTAHGDWRIGFEPGLPLVIHAMTGGEAQLVAAGSDVRLLGGDVALVSAGRAHTLGAGSASAVSLETFMARSPVAGSSRLFLADGPGPPATFVCGAYRFDGDLCRELLASLPPVVHVRPEPGGRLRAALDLLAREIQADVAGQQAILDRLLDVVLVHVLLEHFGRAGDAAPPWFRALSDPEVGRALGLMHTDPARAWSVAELAAAVSLSRSAFARRFTAVMGTPPVHYLTGWRMSLAREELRDRSVPLAVIAHQVGYASEYAFAAAFKRAHGAPPGRWRSDARVERAA